MKSTMLFTMAILVVIFCPGDSKPPDRPTVEAKKSTSMSETERYYVPDYLNFYQPAAFISTIPWVDDNYLRQALRFILHFENNNFLRTPPDKLNFELARAFDNGEKRFMTKQKTVFIGSTERPRDCRLAYDPRTHEILYGRIQATIPLLAASLYHELQHINDLSKSKSIVTRCELEAAAYAAQIRFMAALITGKLLPDELSAIETSDEGVLQAVYESWKALRQNRFCEWYDDRIIHGDPTFDYSGSIFDQNK